jgi:hypothetical protein
VSDAFDDTVDGALDRAEVLLFFRGHESDRFAGGSCAARAPDSMDVVFRDVRDVEVHDVSELLHVDSAGCDVGGHEDAGLAGLELIKCRLTLSLRTVAMEATACDTTLLEELGQAVGTSLGPRSNT